MTADANRTCPVMTLFAGARVDVHMGLATIPVVFCSEETMAKPSFSGMDVPALMDLRKQVEIGFSNTVPTFKSNWICWKR
jgi:hypothetical protein